jgi:hypothetical protein
MSEDYQPGMPDRGVNPKLDDYRQDQKVFRTILGLVVPRDGNLP